MNSRAQENLSGGGAGWYERSSKASDGMHELISHNLRMICSLVRMILSRSPSSIRSPIKSLMNRLYAATWGQGMTRNRVLAFFNLCSLTANLIRDSAIVRQTYATSSICSSDGYSFSGNCISIFPRGASWPTQAAPIRTIAPEHTQCPAAAN